MAREYNMDRRAYLATIGAGTAAGLAGCTGLTGGGGGNTIRPGTAPGFQPFEFRDGGELVGFDIDLTEAIVAETDYELGEWQTFEFDSLIQALTTDKIDMIAAAMTITDDRDETIDFSDPYYSANQSVIVREDGDFAPSSLDDLSGHPIGAQSGTTGETVIQSELIEPGKLEESNYNSYDNYVLAVEDLQNGNIDAVVVDEPVGETFADQRPVSVAFVYETGEQYGFGLRTDDDDRTDAVNSGLQAVRDNGTYEELRNKWFSG
ncbi:basic amino acid ABC transporter substrate-binding protein [Halorarius litoreus]|uniref:basic amino acid ABC transporter substrate-binding protein n=1 Tax=Halorarius litoreus TaxID=2962676 RepID=UPI0020CD65BC|nr:basic amino acid ABC transporter substrate-binding protein [Halorarius litoreus]